MPTPDIARFSHFVALRKDGSTREVAMQLISSVLEADDQGAQRTATSQQISDCLRDDYHFPIHASVIDSAIDQLIFEHRATRALDGQVRLSEAQYALIRERKDKWSLLELAVQTQWKSRLTSILGELSDCDFNDLWQFLTELLANAYARHGSNTISIIQPTAAVSRSSKTEEILLQEASEGHLQAYGEEMLRTIVGSFFAEDSSDRDAYLAWNLTSTFAYYSLFIDQETSEYLKASMESLMVFVDTNFLFGILDLHESPFNETCKQLVDLCHSHKLPVSFHFHEETLRELNDWIDAQSYYLKGTSYSPALSRAAATTQIPLFLKNYHQENARKPITASEYLMRYNSLQKTLLKKGFILFRPSDRERENIMFRGELDAEYSAFLQGRHLRKERSYDAIRHDMIVVSAVRRKTKNSDQPLGTGAYLLTTDGHLAAFVREHLTPAHSRALTIFPSQLLQLIYPLTNLSEGFEKGLAAAFTLPIFRSVEFDRARAQSRILSVSRAIEGLDEDQAGEILNNELLLTSVEQAADDEAVVQAVDNAFSLLNADLKRTVEEQESEMNALHSKISDMEALLQAKNKDQTDLQTKLDEHTDERAELADQIKRSNQRLEVLESQVNKKLPRSSSIFFCLLGVVLTSSVLLIYWMWHITAESSPWLFNHSDRDGIRVLATAALVFLNGAGATLYYRKSWAGFLFGVLLLGAVFGAVGLLGRLP